MKKLLIFTFVITLFLTTEALGRTAFEEAINTAIESKKAEQENRRSDFPGPPQDPRERQKFSDEINEKIPTPKPKIEKQTEK